MTGHEKLIADLELLLTDAKNFEFHDYKNERYAAPKVSLVGRLDRLANNTRNGDYDNAPGEEQ